MAGQTIGSTIGDVGLTTALGAEAAARTSDALHALEELGPGLLGLGGEAFEVLDIPVAHDDGHQHRVVVDGEVVDPGPGDGVGVRLEVRDAGARHLELADLALHGDDHGGGIDREGGGACFVIELPQAPD